MIVSSKIEEAIVFAARAHEGQRRKAGDTPYIAHPIIVGWILSAQTCEEDVVIAGILHDTVEDAGVSSADIARRFGGRVAMIVERVTEQDKMQPWEVRKQRLLESIRTGPLEAKYVYCADKLHNIHSMSAMYRIHGDALWEMFSRGFEQQKWYAHSAVASLYANLDDRLLKPMFFELEQAVKELFG